MTRHSKSAFHGSRKIVSGSDLQNGECDVLERGEKKKKLRLVECSTVKKKFLARGVKRLSIENVFNKAI